MPVFEMLCSHCGSPVQKKEKGEEVKCPVCGSRDVQEKLAASPKTASSGSCSPKG